MSANVFISFASQDRKVAMTLCSALENRGFQCWISARDIQPGENFQTAIVKAIRNAKIMLLVFTANSNTSEEMTKELALASQFKVMVVPLRIEDVAPSDAFAYEFATRQWIDFFSDWELAIQQLSRRIEYAVTQPGPTSKLGMSPEIDVLDEAIEMKSGGAAVATPPKTQPTAKAADGKTDSKATSKIDALFPDAGKAPSKGAENLDKRTPPPPPVKPAAPSTAAAASTPAGKAAVAKPPAVDDGGSKKKLMMIVGAVVAVIVVGAIAAAVALQPKTPAVEDSAVVESSAVPATPITGDVTPIGPAPPQVSGPVAPTSAPVVAPGSRGPSGAAGTQPPAIDPLTGLPIQPKVTPRVRPKAAPLAEQPAQPAAAAPAAPAKQSEPQVLY